MTGWTGIYTLPAASILHDQPDDRGAVRPAQSAPRKEPPKDEPVVMNKIANQVANILSQLW